MPQTFRCRGREIPSRLRQLERVAAQQVTVGTGNGGPGQPVFGDRKGGFGAGEIPGDLDVIDSPAAAGAFDRGGDLVAPTDLHRRAVFGDGGDVDCLE